MIDTVSVTTEGLRDVALVAHLYAEGADFDGGGYEFRLERTSPSLPVPEPSSAAGGLASAAAIAALRRLRRHRRAACGASRRREPRPPA